MKKAPIEDDLRFLRRIKQARNSLRTRHGIKLDAVRPLQERIADIARDASLLSRKRGRAVKKRDLGKLWGND
jgi:hypothetical protein